MERKRDGAPTKIRGGKGVPRSPGSTASSLTVQGVGKSAQRRTVVEEDGGLQGGRDGPSVRGADLGSADGELGTPQGPEARIADGERVASHKNASTSPHCAFSWVESILDERLVDWLDEDIDLYELGSRLEAELLPRLQCRSMSVEKSKARYIIGRGGRMIHRLQEFCGVFIRISGFAPEGVKAILITGPRLACLLAELAIELICQGYYSVLEYLAPLKA